MTDAAPARQHRTRRTGAMTGAIWIGALILLAVAIPLIPRIAPWAATYPGDLVVPATRWVGDAMDWLVNDFDLGLFTFKELTRAIAKAMSVPLDAMNIVLWKGLELDRTTQIGPVSWVGVIAAGAVLAWRLGGWSLALLAVLCLSYMAVFGLWQSSMMTLASILIAVPFGCILGLALGILAHSSKPAESVIIVLLDFMQTVPVFAYLLPVLFLFGFSPVSAMLATMIYAMPAMTRATILGLRTVGDEVIELGTMTGTNKRQMMWKVLVPSAASTLAVGVNQVVVLSLNAVIIASLIGAGGLGFDVLSALRTLRIGQGLEAGVAIVLIAVLLDRFYTAWRDRPPATHEASRRPWSQRYAGLIWAGAALAIFTLLSLWVPALARYPDAWQISSGRILDNAVDYVTITYYPWIQAFSTFMYLKILNPTRDALLALPWSVVVIALMLAGWRLRGAGLALAVGAMSGAIVVLGFWQESMITVYLIGISVIIAVLIGVPLGVAGALNDRLSGGLRVVADTLQTLPSFVYLVPVVMLFQVGDIPAIIAVVLYAVAPAIRYTDMGLRKVDPALIEAARMMGCSRLQILRRVQVPLAMPEILLGLNQTVMLAISMLVITALVGTRDLGQVVYVGLSRADTGLGLVAGACVAFIAIIADRLLQALAARQRANLGLH